MTRRWRFVIDGAPGTKQRARSGRRAGGRHHTTANNIHYEALVAGAAMEAGVDVGDGQCDIIIEVWAQASDASEGEERRRARVKKDLDNITKIVLDGILKAGAGALADDNIDHVRSITSVRAGWGRPRVEVTIIEVSEEHVPELLRVALVLLKAASEDTRGVLSKARSWLKEGHL
ncbi:MAG: RusA family crossover junction endodeoxyribonuclease [Gammaproteobacteria bacterium]|nr:RusA family crossover junction endodeoxyribonuclease [Gammaproteobacteria bacterium]